jgi:hypothetical protein
VIGLVWSDGPESYAHGSCATGRVSHAGQEKDDEPDTMGYPRPLGRGLGRETNNLASVKTDSFFKSLTMAAIRISSQKAHSIYKIM